MPLRQAVSVTVEERPAIDPRVERARPQWRAFALLTLQLAAVLTVFKVYKLEQPAFFTLSCLVFGGFAASYWLPFRWKEPFLILLSLGGAYVLLSPSVASLLIGIGLLFFAIVRSPLLFRWKATAIFGLAAALAYARSTARFPLPQEFWPVFGAVFSLRMIVYLYDLKYRKTKASLQEYLSYFYILPNYVFILFPVIDFKTMRTSYFSRKIDDIAQDGVQWIVRGTTHLLLYRLIYQWQVNVSPPKVAVPVAVVAKSVLYFLLYLRVSGSFHIISGMLKLFGYDLPLTNRYYLLSNSFSDFWRRINIYWRDFMEKVFYFPVYFKLRRKGDLRARMIATGAVFVATWFLHAYQFFWVQDQFLLKANDILFWLILLVPILAGVWRTSTGAKRPPRSGWLPALQNASQVVLTIGFVIFLWSMWSADNLTEWLRFLKTGNI